MSLGTNCPNDVDIDVVTVRPAVSPVPAKGMMKVVEGEAAELRCKVTQGSPEPDITWKRKVSELVSVEINGSTDCSCQLNSLSD